MLRFWWHYSFWSPLSSKRGIYQMYVCLSMCSAGETTIVSTTSRSISINFSTNISTKTLMHSTSSIQWPGWLVRPQAEPNSSIHALFYCTISNQYRGNYLYYQSFRTKCVRNVVPVPGIGYLTSFL